MATEPNKEFNAERPYQRAALYPSLRSTSMGAPKRERKPPPRPKRLTRKRTRTHDSSSAAPNEAVRATPENVETSTPKSVLTHEIKGLVYTFDREPKKNGKRTVLTAKLAGNGQGKSVIDRIDIFSIRSRKTFAGAVSDTFGLPVGDVIGHMGLILDEIERAEVPTGLAALPILTPERTKAAERLLASKDILDRAAEAFDALGYVGEEKTKKLAYLVATSRLLHQPLSGIILAPSASGKSDLLDKLALLVPEESVEFLSRLTPASLYYMGADYLRHRLVLVDEQAGTSEADYSIRTLQTKGLLRLAATVKGRTEPFTVYGPIALMSGTTDHQINPENLSRCLELILDDSPEQTKLIQQAQRKAWAGKTTSVNLEVWKDAQRLLEPLQPVIPFAEELGYPTRTTKDRRDNQKLLSLVGAHALLHQRQRERNKDGKLVATKADYAAIYDLIRTSVEQDVEGLSARGTVLYRHLAVHDRERFTRRHVKDKLGWSYMTVKRSLDELLAHELVSVVGGTEKPLQFTLIEKSVLGPTATLTPPAKLK
jgi:hypothetical protein